MPGFDAGEAYVGCRGKEAGCQADAGEAYVAGKQGARI